MHSIADIRRQRCPAKRAGRVRYVPRKALRERAPGLASIGNLGLRARRQYKPERLASV